jgi:hypothetical protein
MSDLALVNQFSTDDILAQLAAEQGLSTEIEEYSGGGRIYTNFTRIENVRNLTSSWMDKPGYLQWNAPGQQEKIEKFGRGFPYVNEIEGFILHSEIQPGQYEDNTDETSNSKTKPVCTLVGYKNSKGEYIKKLPSALTFFNKMYGAYDEATKKPVYTTPNNNVKDLGFLGSRGMSCFDCITSGKSTKENPKDSNKPYECKLRGKIHMFVTHLRCFFEEGDELVEEVKSVQELMGEPGFVIAINLPTVMGLRGSYDKLENDLIKKKELHPKKAIKHRQSYLSYQTALKLKYKKTPVESSLLLVPVNLSVLPPVPGETQPKNYLIFSELGLFDRALMGAAKEARETYFPNKEDEILDPSNWVINGVGGTTMYSTAKVADYSDDLHLPLLEATEEPYEEEPSNIPF